MCYNHWPNMNYDDDYDYKEMAKWTRKEIGADMAWWPKEIFCIHRTFYINIIRCKFS